MKKKLKKETPGVKPGVKAKATNMKPLLELDGPVKKESFPGSSTDNTFNFKSGAEIGKFLETNDFNDALFKEDTFDKVLKDWDLLDYIHESISQQLVNDFTEGQIACIFEVINEESLRLDVESSIELQAKVLNYISIVGKDVYNLGDVDEFLSRVKSLYPIVFTVLVSKIRRHYEAHFNTERQKDIITGFYEFTHNQSEKLLAGI
jgi:hypothetical protein